VAQIAQILGEDAAGVPNVSPVDPLDSNFDAMAGASGCRKN
jgi:hypothetical protein